MIEITALSFGSGAGHLFCGFSIWKQLKKNCPFPFHFSILTDSPINLPIEDETLDVYPISLEADKIFKHDKTTQLYQYLVQLDPDIIIVDHIWLPMVPILENFKAIKIIFFRFVPPEWFQTPRIDGTSYRFNPDDYDLSFSIEPEFGIEGASDLPPLIGFDPSNLKSPDIIRSVFQVPPGKKLALVAHNGLDGEIKTILKGLDTDPYEYEICPIDSYSEQSRILFPLVDYMSGVDLVIGACGYNFFYETKALGINTIYIPQQRLGNEQHWRLEHNAAYQGQYNGAEQFVKEIIELI